MPPTATFRSHPGLVREQNEDAVLVAAGGRLLACADGLGGLPAGEEASRLAVGEIQCALEPHFTAQGVRAGEKAWRERLRRAFLTAHAAILEAGSRLPEQRGMATTLVAAVTTARRAYLCHVGDVRAYLSSRGELLRLTDDHSAVFERVKAGTLHLEAARVHPERNVVTQALGLAEGLAPATTVTRLRRGDLLLLCSDGLWETMPESELGAVLASVHGLERTADALLALALGAGGPDNISLVLYQHD
jgi:protein phosphatase